MTASATASPTHVRHAFSLEKAITSVLVITKIGVHLVLANRYGRHRDEYYFIDCGDHLSFGYVDHAPLVPWLAGASSALFGDSLLMLRLPAILAGGATVWLTIRLARRFGAGAYGQALAGLAIIFAPAFLRMHGMLTIPAFEPVFWTVAAIWTIDLLDGADKKRWLLIGAVVGLGLLNKHTMLLWAAGMAVGVLATPLREDLKTKWPWLGALIALFAFSPNLLWQAHNDWPTLRFIQIMGDTVLADIPRSLFLAGQVLYFGVVATVIWMCGLIYFFTDAGKRYRLFGVLFVAVLALLTLMHAKPYYSAPAYPLVFAAGGAWLGRWLESRPGARRGFNVTLVSTSLALALITLPIFPLTTVDTAIGKMLGWVVRPVDLTHDMHDELGWRAQSVAVAEVFERLTLEERRTSTIFTENYGQASAINLHGSDFGLPRATSGHMSHFLWGPDASRTGPLVLVGVHEDKRARLCVSPEEWGRITNEDAMESDVPIHVCRDHVPLDTVWPSLERYYHARRQPTPTP